MRFGPLELQACGENNFTMKALGILAFRPDLRARFVQKLAGPGALAPRDGEVSILFFSRIGEGFFREVKERERDEKPGALEARLNAALDLPRGFRWPRRKDGRLVQPNMWRASHIREMLRVNGKAEDQELHERLKDLQDCLNTEPDVVLQWGRKLALIEIKVLSPEGDRQIDRQIRLGQMLSRLLGWEVPLFFLIGPEHGGRPPCADCRFVSWAAVADWFSDVPEIVNYIRSFTFFYDGHWQSMVSAHATASGETAYDLLRFNPRQESPSAGPAQPKIVSQPRQTLHGPPSDPWHFSHLGRQYFLAMFRGCRENGVWPLRWIWIGTTGVPFAEKLKGRQIHPNWMVEDTQGQRRTRSGGFKEEGRYNEGRMRRFSYNDVAQYFNLR